ncbi:MAG: 2-aminophenol/2-amino-5-chlorophenol 1,6-dioxygenase alpha subunit [Myxococcota bacterium]|jgi:2-aminophenol/2-amino-5-chlorophenol 1,6-dioxygenase alpha subunit
MSPFSLIVPGLPHPLLAPEGNPGWGDIRAAFEQARAKIEASDADLLLLYSTQWFSILGHQIQADPAPEWVHVDQEFHELGTMPYRFRMDADFAEAYNTAAKARGLHCRTIAYKGFPIDTGSVVALKLLNPDNRIPACLVSCNMYSDRAETVILGKAAADAAAKTGRRIIPVAVTCLTNRLHTSPIEPSQDRISSLMDDEWNRKLLELLGEGRLEDVSQLARTFTSQAHADNKLKALWWLAAVSGQHNRYKGEVLSYQPIWGAGAAVVALTPTGQEAGGHEFDEDSVDVYLGDREVLDTGSAPESAPVVTPAAKPVTAKPVAAKPAPTEPAASSGIVKSSAAPKPVGAYPHARRVGDLLYLSGVGPRQPGTDAIPGGPIRDGDGTPQDYDIEAQTHAVINNVRIILEASGSSLDKVLDITTFLVDMDRDFSGYNKVYAEYFTKIQAARTTVAITALPTPIAIELKVIALA